MECLYIPAWDHTDVRCEVEGDEFRHMRSLRLRADSSVAVSNGRGALAACRVESIGKITATLVVDELLLHEHAPATAVQLVLGVLDDRSRMEFAIEKAVECGATAVFPLISDHVQHRKFNRDRAHRKAVAALKQSHQAWLCEIHDPMIGLDAVLESPLLQESTLIGFDASAHTQFEKAALPATSHVTCFIGPEGGWSTSELALLRDRVLMFGLGHKRLRAETAAIVALGKLL